MESNPYLEFWRDNLKAWFLIFFLLVPREKNHLVRFQNIIFIKIRLSSNILFKYFKIEFGINESRALHRTRLSPDNFFA